MKIAIIGRGLIGGSIEKSAIRAGHEATMFRGRSESPALAGFDIVVLAVPPSAVLRHIDMLAHNPTLSDGAIVVDIAGVKSTVCDAAAKLPKERKWHFVPGHPMAGKERTGYENSVSDLFDGASMILTPLPETPAHVIEKLDAFFTSLGFSQVVKTDSIHHDKMIAFTSQLCHLISSAYVREPLAAEHGGYSAGSFRDMIRVGAPDPEVWTELFMLNRESLLPVLGDYIARLEDFKSAIEHRDAARLQKILRDGIAAKAKIDEGIRG